MRILLLLSIVNGKVHWPLLLRVHLGGHKHDCGMAQRIRTIALTCSRLDDEVEVGEVFPPAPLCSPPITPPTSWWVGILISIDMLWWSWYGAKTG